MFFIRLEVWKATPDRSDVLQQLRELNELKQMGVLTEEEFTEKKKVLLDDLN